MMNITSWGENSEEAVRAFEQELGFPLPKDYRHFLLKHNGATVNDQSFVVPDLDEEILMHVLYGITSSRARSLTVGYWLKEFDDEMGPNELIIGKDQGGHPILYITSGEDEGIYFWDTNHFFAKSSEEEGNTYFVAASFTEFCNSLQNFAPAQG